MHALQWLQNLLQRYQLQRARYPESRQQRQWEQRGQGSTATRGNVVHLEPGCFNESRKQRQWERRRQRSTTTSGNVVHLDPGCSNLVVQSSGLYLTPKRWRSRRCNNSNHILHLCHHHGTIHRRRRITNLHHDRHNLLLHHLHHHHHLHPHRILLHHQLFYLHRKGGHGRGNR